jgi:hypothetical protein
MFRLLQYYGQFQGFRGRLLQLPAWARLVILVAAIPGVLLLALSLLAFLVSLLALLLLTVPLYRLLSAAFGIEARPTVTAVPGGVAEMIDDPAGVEPPVVVETPVEGAPRPTRRQIEVKIVE